MKFAVIFISVFISALNLSAQVSFHAKFKRTDLSYNNDIITLQDGNYITKEATKPDANSRRSIIITKFNHCHEVLWSKSIETEGNDQGNLIRTIDNGLIMTYYVKDGLNYWPALMKLDKLGNLAWAKVLHFNLPSGTSAFYATASSGITTSNGGYVIAINARYESATGKEYMLFLSKVDSGGTLIWSKKITVPTASLFMGKISSNEEAFFIPLADNFFGNPAPYLLKTDSNGNVLWLKKCNQSFLPPISNYNLNIYDAHGDTEGNTYYIGYNTAGNKHTYLMKIDKTGKALWIKYIQADHYTFTSIEMLNERIILNGASSTEIMFLDLDKNGAIKMARVLPNNYSGLRKAEFARHVDGGLMAFVSSNKDFGIFKFDDKGQFECPNYDTLITFSQITTTTIDEPYQVYDGFLVKDIAVTVENYKNKLTIICSSQPIPMAELPADTAPCASTPLTLSAGPQNQGCTLLWSTGETTDSISITKSGRYWLQASYGTCQSSDTIEIVFQDELAGKLPDTIAFCSYDSVELVMPDSLYNKLYWLLPDGTKKKDKRFWTSDTGTYYLAIEGNSSCKDLDTLHLLHHVLPAADAGPDTLLCYNQEYTMQGSGGITYKWTPATYLSSDSLPDALAKLPQTQAYKLIVMNEYGCSDTGDVTLTVRPPLTLKATVYPSKICEKGTVQLSAEGQGGLGAPSYDYYWPGQGQHGKSITAQLSASGWQKAILKDGCSPEVADSVWVEVVPLPQPSFSVLPDDSFYTGREMRFRNGTQHGVHYRWDFGDGSTSSQESPVHEYTQEGIYTLTFTASNSLGCSDSIVQHIHVGNGQVSINIPNAFTPNDDGINDRFTIGGLGIRSHTLQIYSRWGQQLLQDAVSWDGSHRGSLVPEGIYLYTLQVTDIFNRRHYFSGEVTVVY